MPPGSRPIQGNGSMLRPPKQMSQTQAVAQGGKAALDQRRQAASYDLSGQAQGLKDLYGQIQSQGSGYSTNPGQTDAYAQWMQQRGFGAQDYPVTFGRTDKGAYSGFKTEGELKAAILGQSELTRQQDLDQAAALKDLMQSKLSGLDQQYTQNAATPTGASIASLAALGNAGAREARTFGAVTGLGVAPQVAARTDQAAHVADVQQQRTGDYMGKLTDWYQKQAEPLVTGMETANQISRTPTRDYATVAGQGYGVDPNLIAGWFPTSGEITDAANQRNLQSLHETGLPYDEQQRTLQQLNTEQNTQAKQATADQQVQMDNEIYQATTYPGDSLASAASLPIEAVHQIVTDPYFAGASSTVETVRSQAEAQHDPNTDQGAAAIQAAVDEAIQASVDDTASTGDTQSAQALERILHTLYDLG